MGIALHAGQTVATGTDDYPLGRKRVRLAFAMMFALMLSDYLSRQVMGAVFPMLKLEWGLSDAQLGSLVSVVALPVAVMSFPLSLLSDRIGRVRSITLMALVWGGASIACGLAQSFVALLIARAMIGLSEAGYGGTGAALLTGLYPTRAHASVLGTFISAAIFGSVLGVVLGGVLADHQGLDGALQIIPCMSLLASAVYFVASRSLAATNPPPEPYTLETPDV